MILEFRTKGDKPHYLCFDTGAEIYSTWARAGTTLNLPQLSVRDYNELIARLENNGYYRVCYV